MKGRPGIRWNELLSFERTGFDHALLLRFVFYYSALKNRAEPVVGRMKKNPVQEMIEALKEMKSMHLRTVSDLMALSKMFLTNMHLFQSLISKLETMETVIHERRIRN